MPVAVPRPSGLSEPGAVPVLVVGSLAVGLVAGVALGVVSQWFSLLILFPAVLGLAVGGFAAWRVGRARIRAPLLAGAAALVGALTAQATVHAVDYVAFRRSAAAELRAEAPGADVDAEIDGYLLAETGWSGLPGFFELRAKRGVGVERHGRTTNFTGWGAYGLWLLEFLVAGVTAAWLGFDRARQPFCEHCKRWYDGSEVLAVGAGEKVAWKATREALARGDLAGALGSRGAPGEKAASLFHLASCTRCEAHVPILTFFSVARPGKPKEAKTARHRTGLRFEEARELRGAAAARSAG